MRATEEQLRRALVSGDAAQRTLAALHIERGRPELFSLMLQVLRESQPVGRHDHLHLTAARMVRDEPTLDAFLELLPMLRERWRRGEMYLDDPMSQIVRDIPADLLMSRYWQLRPLCREPYAIEVCRMRGGWLRREPTTCLRVIEAFGRKYADYRDTMPYGGDSLEYAAESAARDVALSREWFNARLERLSVLPNDYPQGDLFWTSHLAIELAGHAGLREAVPLILGCFGLDDDLFNESCHHSLRRLIDTDVLRMMDEYFDDHPGWPRRSCASIAGDHPLPETAAVFARWLEFSHDEDELGTIATAAAGLLEPSLLPAIERVVISADWDAMYSDLAGDYLAACAILEVEPAQPQRIKTARAKAQRRRARLYGDFGRLQVDPPAVQPSVVPPAMPVNRIKVGPNDVCLCGSGRKFKKCCMNKPVAG